MRCRVREGGVEKSETGVLPSAPALFGDAPPISLYKRDKLF